MSGRKLSEFCTEYSNIAHRKTTKFVKKDIECEHKMEANGAESQVIQVQRKRERGEKKCVRSFADPFKHNNYRNTQFDLNESKSQADSILQRP